MDEHVGGVIARSRGLALANPGDEAISVFRRGCCAALRVQSEIATLAKDRLARNDTMVWSLTNAALLVHTSFVYFVLFVFDCLSFT